MPGKSNKRKEEEPLIAKTIQYEFAVFFTHNPPREFNRHLRNIIVDYLTNEPEPGFDLEKAMHAVWKFMRFLDKAEDEVKQRTFTEIFDIAKKGGYPRFDPDD